MQKQIYTKIQCTNQKFYESLFEQIFILRNVKRLVEQIIDLDWVLSAFLKFLIKDMFIEQEQFAKS